MVEPVIQLIDFSKLVKNRLTASVALVGNTGKGKSAACNLLAKTNEMTNYNYCENSNQNSTLMETLAIYKTPNNG